MWVCLLLSASWPQVKNHKGKFSVPSQTLYFLDICRMNEWRSWVPIVVCLTSLLCILTLKNDCTLNGLFCVFFKINYYWNGPWFQGFKLIFSIKDKGSVKTKDPTWLLTDIVCWNANKPAEKLRPLMWCLHWFGGSGLTLVNEFNLLFHIDRNLQFSVTGLPWAVPQALYMSFPSWFQTTSRETLRLMNAKSAPLPLPLWCLSLSMWL